MSDLWTWREIVVLAEPTGDASSAISGTDVTGFDAEATDGKIGKIDAATYDIGGSYVVVDTGFWIFGKKRMIPANVVQRVDPTEKTVYLRMTKDEVKDAPDYDPDRLFGDQQSEHDTYYGASSNRK